MKKSIAVLMLGSALLLPNNTSVEASYSDNDGLVQKAQNVQCYVLESKYPTLQLTKYMNKVDFDQAYQLIKSQEDKKQEKWALAKDKKIAKHNHKNEQSKSVEENSSAKPVEKPDVKDPEESPEANPTPEVTPQPETKPEPEVTPEQETTTEQEVTPVPEAKPEQETPAEVTPSEPAESTQDASLSAMEQAVLDLTNAERQKAGLQPLQADSNLMNSARQKSADMASNGYFSHTSPTYGSPFDQMKANGVNYSSAAENIAMGQRSAEEVVKAWMESPGHRQNILTPEFTHIGIGFDQNGNYWTQQFIQK
ncbi:CAP domain-containing protein [Sporosarcina sp. ACRSM]|uniref:CAP domain-containing protein n=1 Tax=Sporosarcina sp. ACRSM TaxID=2918216 RepID=UPI001EF6B4AD|nr:CAP domain-containing protein [Sporosarcina sp. ACRSM]MCG7334507.1 CAP domain-containing protein [Sporosarcina sp. ACRSM]